MVNYGAQCVKFAYLKSDFGLELPRERQFQRAIVESDCLMAVTEIHKQEASFSEWFPIIKDILAMHNSFNSLSIQYVNRSCNCIADGVSRALSLGVNYAVWEGSLPPDVFNLDIIRSNLVTN